MVTSISRQQKQTLAIQKMLLVDEKKDYYRIKGHCSRMFCSGVAYCQSWLMFGGGRRVRTPDGFVNILETETKFGNPQNSMCRWGEGLLQFQRALFLLCLAVAPCQSRSKLAAIAEFGFVSNLGIETNFDNSHIASFWVSIFLELSLIKTSFELVPTIVVCQEDRQS